MKALILALALQSFLQISAQESDIYVDRQSRKVYLGIDNPINVFVQGIRCSSLSVSTDNGTIQKMGCHYYYHPTRTGDAGFTIFKKQNGKSVKVQTHKLYVVPFPPPIAQVGPHESGSAIPKGAFCAQQGVAAFPINGLGFDLTFKVLSFSFIIMLDSTIQFNTQIIGNLFNEKIYEVCKTMASGSVVLISNIVVMGPEGKAIRVNPLEYFIQ